LKITEKEFEKIYEPIINQFELDKKTFLFKDCGEQFDFISKQSPNNIFTLIEKDGQKVLVAGIAFLNRIGFYVTKRSWEDYWSELEIIMDD